MLSELFKRLGFLLLADDYKDIGEMDRFHHWQWGFLLMELGAMFKKLENDKNTWADLWSFLVQNGAVFLQMFSEAKKRRK